MRIIQADLGTLHPLIPRKGAVCDVEIEASQQMLQVYGQIDPLVIQASSGKVVGGDLWLIAMRGLGWERCNVVELGLDDSSAHGLALLIDREAELAGSGESVLERVPAYQGEMGDSLDVGFDEKQGTEILAGLDSAIGLASKVPT